MIILLGVPLEVGAALKTGPALAARKNFVEDRSSGDFKEYRYYDSPAEPVDEVFVEIPPLGKNAGISELHASGLLLTAFSVSNIPVIDVECNYNLVYHWLALAVELLERAAAYTNGIRTFTLQVREDEAVVCSFKRFNV